MRVTDCFVMDFLSEIIAVKKQRLAAAKARLPLDQIRGLAREMCVGTHPHAFARALGSDHRINLIAEFKRRSPSKGKINSHADAAATARIYESAGAAAISVLTEEDYFAGSLEDLRRVREVTRLPILRKDFVFDEYQVYESAAAGADAILLIVAALDDQMLAKLRTMAEEELGMDALVEVHTKAELDRAVRCGARLIGVNNRDLRTFKVSVAVSEQLARVAPRDAILVSESGLNPDEVRKLRAVGYRGFLVGETLMRADDPGKKLREFIQEPAGFHSARSVWVKICGITNVEDARAAIEAGADMLGLNFYRASPRFIEPKAAAEIVSHVQSQDNATHRSVIVIGVFVNESIDETIRIADEAGVNGIQLHGDETIEFCEQIRARSPQRFVIKAVRPDDRFSVEMLSSYPADAIMIDAFNANLRGGTGRTADWEIASDAAKKLPRVFLAGGLSPENIGQAIEAVQPYGVDACSSLETAPGRKSAKRMREFVDAARASTLQGEISHSSTGEGN
jgi:indole-3-glycerol phosphate synthase/phosphoribosylanthranilate isomerase